MDTILAMVTVTVTVTVTIIFTLLSCHMQLSGVVQHQDASWLPFNVHDLVHLIILMFYCYFILDAFVHLVILFFSSSFFLKMDYNFILTKS